MSACPEHYWFAFWLKRGYRVTCSACGETREPNAVTLRGSTHAQARAALAVHRAEAHS